MSPGESWAGDPLALGVRPRERWGRHIGRTQGFGEPPAQLSSGLTHSLESTLKINRAILQK